MNDAKKIAHTSPITGVSIFEKKNIVISTGYDGQSILWNLINLSPIWKFQAPHLLNSADFSINGEKLSLSCADKYVYILETNSGKLLNVIGNDKQQQDDVNVAKWIDDKTIVTGCDTEDPTIRFWDVVSGKAVKTFIGHSDSITDIDFDKNHTRFVSTGEDSTTRIWDAQTQEMLFTIEHSHDAETVAWKDNLIITGGNDGFLKFWDSNTFALIHKTKLKGAVRSIAKAEHDDAILAGVYGGHLHLVNLNDFSVQTLSPGIRRWERGIDLSDHWAAVGSFGSAPFIYSRKTQNAVSKPAPTFGANCVAVLNGAAYVGLDSGDVFSVNQKSSLYQHETIINGICHSPCGRYLASGDYAGIVIIYDLLDNTKLCEKKVSAGPVNAIVWPTADLLYCGGYDCNIYSLDKTLKSLNYWVAHKAPIKNIQYSEKDQALITSSSDNMIIKWHGIEKEIIFSDDAMYLVNAIDVQDKSLSLVSASRDKTVRIWDLETGALKHQIKDIHERSVKSVCFHLDKMIVISAGYDSKVMLSKLNSAGEWVSSLVLRHQMPGVSAVAQLDENNFISVGWDQTYNLFSVDGEIKETGKFQSTMSTS